MTDLAKMKCGEIQTQSVERLEELEQDVRMALAKTRMEVFAEKGVNGGKRRQLRKNLARVLTIAKQKNSQNG